MWGPLHHLREGAGYLLVQALLRRFGRVSWFNLMEALREAHTAALTHLYRSTLARIDHGCSGNAVLLLSVLSIYGTSPRTSTLELVRCMSPLPVFLIVELNRRCKSYAARETQVKSSFVLYVMQAPRQGIPAYFSDNWSVTAYRIQACMIAEVLVFQLFTCRAATWLEATASGNFVVGHGDFASRGADTHTFAA